MKYRYARESYRCDQSGMTRELCAMLSGMSNDLKLTVLTLISTVCDPANWKSKAKYDSFFESRSGVIPQQQLRFVYPTISSHDGVAVDLVTPLFPTNVLASIKGVRWTWREIRTTLGIGIENCEDLGRHATGLVCGQRMVEGNLLHIGMVEVGNESIYVEPSSRLATICYKYPPHVANSFTDPWCPPLRRALNIASKFRKGNISSGIMRSHISAIHPVLVQVVQRGSHMSPSEMLKAMAEAIAWSEHAEIHWVLPACGSLSGIGEGQYEGEMSQVQARYAAAAMGLYAEDFGVLRATFSGIKVNGEMDDSVVKMIAFPTFEKISETSVSSAFGTTKFQSGGVSTEYINKVRNSYNSEVEDEPVYPKLGYFIDHWTPAAYEAAEKGRPAVQETKRVRRSRREDFGYFELTKKLANGTLGKATLPLYESLHALSAGLSSGNFEKQLEKIGKCGTMSVLKACNDRVKGLIAKEFINPTVLLAAMQDYVEESDDATSEITAVSEPISGGSNVE